MTDKNKKTATYSSLRGFHRAVPIIVISLAVFLAFCFITKDMGIFGNAISGLLLGLFSYGAYAFPLLMILHAVLYASDLDEKRLLSRVIFSLVTITSIAALGYAICYWNAEPAFNLIEFYRTAKAGVGGGFIGGLIGFCLIRAFSKVGLIIITAAVFAVYISYFFAKGDSRLLKAMLMIVKVLFVLFEMLVEGIVSIFKKIKNSKDAKNMRQSEQKNMELTYDEFFDVDNGISKLNIPDLGIKETRTKESAEANPTLQDKIFYKSIATPEEAEEMEEREMRERAAEMFAEERAARAARTTAESHPEQKERRRLINVSYDDPASEAFERRNTEPVFADDAEDFAEEAINPDTVVQTAFISDANADAVFTRDFDPFSMVMSEELASKPSSRSLLDESPAPKAVKEDISEITEADIERARKLDDFERKKAALLASRRSTPVATPVENDGEFFGTPKSVEFHEQESEKIEDVASDSFTEMKIEKAELPKAEPARYTSIGYDEGEVIAEVTSNAFTTPETIYSHEEPVSDNADAATDPDETVIFDSESGDDGYEYTPTSSFSINHTHSPEATEESLSEESIIPLYQSPITEPKDSYSEETEISSSERPALTFTEPKAEENAAYIEEDSIPLFERSVPLVDEQKDNGRAETPTYIEEPTVPLYERSVTSAATIDKNDTEKPAYVEEPTVPLYERRAPDYDNRSQSAPGYGYQNQPAPGYGYQNQPAPGYGYQNQPAPGYGYPNQPAPGYGYPNQPAPGYGYPNQPAPGYGYPNQPAPGYGYPNQPAPGYGYPNQPAPGYGYPNQPAPGYGYPNQPAPGYGYQNQPDPTVPSSEIKESLNYTEIKNEAPEAIETSAQSDTSAEVKAAACEAHTDEPTITVSDNESQVYTPEFKDYNPTKTVIESDVDSSEYTEEDTANTLTVERSFIAENDTSDETNEEQKDPIEVNFPEDDEDEIEDEIDEITDPEEIETEDGEFNTVEIPVEERNPVVQEFHDMFFGHEDNGDDDDGADDAHDLVSPDEIEDENNDLDDNYTDSENGDDGDDYDTETDDPPFEATSQVVSKPAEKPKQEPAPKKKAPSYANYKLPPIDLLGLDPATDDDTSEITENTNILIDTLASFNVTASIKGVDRGPRITRYEVVPARGVKVQAITSRLDDITLNLAKEGVRMEAPIPGKAAVGFEIPNKNPRNVRLRELLECEEFLTAKSKTFVSIGKDVAGNPIFGDIAKYPHALICGATGMGKSVCINSILISILYKARPDEVKLIMVDPKKVEFKMYGGIPHLLIPVITESKQAAGALMWAVEEMERRYELIEKFAVRNIEAYNAKVAADPSIGEKLPKIVIVIDELADLMIQVRDPAEDLIMRIAQKARAAGIHLIIGTQRPSVQVITGAIKANIPSRISCKVTSQVDSRTIFDMGGAEKLLARGDMLYWPVDRTKAIRVQGAFVSDTEVEDVINYVKANTDGADYDEDVLSEINKAAQKCGNKKGGGVSADDIVDDDEPDFGYYSDQQFLDAVDLAIRSGKISTSLLQRKLSIGYGKAAKYIDAMEDIGVVSEPRGQKPREILMSMEEWREKLSRVGVD